MKPIKEMTDRELQETIAHTNRNISRKTSSIEGWITFIGVIIIIGLILAIIAGNSLDILF